VETKAPTKFPADDRYVRFTFSGAERVAGLIREFLPPELVACLDLSRLRRIHDQHVHKSLRENRDDLNLECPLYFGRVMVIRILVEHKSDHDRNLWFQLHRSIVNVWEEQSFQPILCIVIHTGPEQFQFHSPQFAMSDLPVILQNDLPNLPIHVIDLSQYERARIWNSQYLDHVAKVALIILRLVHEKSLDIAYLRKLLNDEWPQVSKARRNRYIKAAISYLKFKSPESTIVQQLRSDMPFVHSINPDSLFARELREEHEKGITQGITEGQELQQIETIQAMLTNGLDWSLIKTITHLDQSAYETLKAKHQK